MNFDLIVATDENNGIGIFKNNQFKDFWHTRITTEIQSVACLRKITSDQKWVKSSICANFVNVPNACERWQQNEICYIVCTLYTTHYGT